MESLRLETCWTGNVYSESPLQIQKIPNPKPRTPNPEHDGPEGGCEDGGVRTGNLSPGHAATLPPWVLCSVVMLTSSKSLLLEVPVIWLKPRKVCGLRAELIGFAQNTFSNVDLAAGHEWSFKGLSHRSN
jgi:hypothetical protein